MSFDYRLRPGLATSRNALRLMQLVGIDLHPDERRYLAFCRRPDIGGRRLSRARSTRADEVLTRAEIREVECFLTVRFAAGLRETLRKRVRSRHGQCICTAGS